MCLESKEAVQVCVLGGREHSPWSETELCVKVVNSHVFGGLVVCVAQLLLRGEA